MRIGLVLSVPSSGEVSARGVGASFAGSSALTVSGNTVGVSASFASASALTVSGNTVGLDLAAIAWTGWWNGDNYNATSGVASGIASAGASSGRDLSIASNKPTKGNTVNGYNGIIFNGSTNKLANATLTLGDLVANNANTYFAVINITDSAGVGPGAAPCVLTDSQGYFNIGYEDTTPVVGSYLYSGSYKAALRTLSLGSVIIVESWHDGTNLKTSVNGGTAATIAAGSITSVAFDVLMGVSYDSAYFLHGTIYEFAITNTTLSSGDRTSVRQALATKYGVTL